MNGVCSIDIQGKSVRLKFAMPAMRIVFSKAVQPAGMDDVTYKFMMLARVLHAGYVNNCYLKDEEPVLEFEDFFDLLEEAEGNPELTKQIENAAKVFDESKFIQNSKKPKDDEGADEEKKSQLTGTKSKKQPLVKSESAQKTTSD